MTIELYTNLSDYNTIIKDITLQSTLTGTLKNETETIINPHVLIESSTYPTANYAHITDFGRYYFIKEIKAVRSHIWELALDVDVLMSFNLSSITGILVETENNNSNMYLPSRGFVKTCKTKTDIINFPYGLLESGEYILITAGGSI